MIWTYHEYYSAIKKISDGCDNLDGSQGLFSKYFNVSVGLHSTVKWKSYHGKQIQSCQVLDAGEEGGRHGCLWAV